MNQENDRYSQIQPEAFYTSDEEERLKALYAYEILDTPDEPEFDALTRLARQICNTELSQINFVDRNRQWNKASVPESPKEMIRGGSFCSTTIQQDQFLVVEDTTQDDRFSFYPFVRDDPNVRFYAGINLKSDSGHNIGTICVLGLQPKKLEPWQIESLQILASEVEARLELKRNQATLKKQNLELEKQTTFLENSTDLVMMLDPVSHEITDIHERVIELLGYTREELIGHLLDTLAHKPLIDALSTWTNKSSDLFQGEYRLKHRDGSDIWVHLHMTEKGGQWYATAQDITQRKVQEIKLEASLKEKVVLISEIHHRVKNNLAIIAGMLELEAMHMDDEQSRMALQKNQLRIQSMSNIHELLYDGNDFANVAFQPFLEKLTKSIRSLVKSDPHPFELELSIDSLTLNVNQAIPAGLLLNEVISNTCKFLLRHLEAPAKYHLYLAVLEEDGEVTFRFENRSGSIALQEPVPDGVQTPFNLIELLAKQLHASLETDRETEPTTVIIRFQKRTERGTSNAFLMPPEYR
ncbi:MAG: histidine kinase dimerization/phosphoacceptor domain -containing protein [Balneolaceae bacterium]